MIFNIKNRIVDINGINRSINKTQRALLDIDGEVDLTTIPINELNEIVYNSEKIALSCRQAIEIKEYKEEGYFDETYEKICTKNNPVSINYADNILKIKTPITLKRMNRESTQKENYMLMNYVDVAIKDYTEKHGPLLESVKIPLVAIIKRTSPSFHSNKICDNDNIENGRVINEIMGAIGCGDNAMVMDIYSCFRICKSIEETGTEFIIAPQDRFIELFELLKTTY